MNSDFSLTTCSTCAGFGSIANGEGVATCPACQGTGMTAEVDKSKLIFHFPEIVAPRSPESRRLVASLRTVFLVIDLGITLAALVSIVLNSPDWASLLWQHNLVHALFGIFGLLSIWELANWNVRHTSSQDLTTLRSRLGKDMEIDLHDYLNSRVGELLSQAAYRAKQLRSTVVDDGILLTTLLEQPRIRMIISRLEISPDDVYDAVVGSLAAAGSGNVSTVVYQPVIRERLYHALQEALNRNFPYVDIEDILLAYAMDPREFKSVFENFRLTENTVYHATRWYAGEQERIRRWAFWRERGRSRPTGFMNRAWTALPTPVLDHFSTDITELAGLGSLPSASVRTQEVEHILEILAGSNQQHNVILVGEPGVGKNTLLGAVARRMLEDSVPENLRDKRLVQLDVGAVVKSPEGGKEFMQKILEEVMQAGNVILAIPQLQALSGEVRSGLDGSTLLAGAIDSGHIQVITTATPSDFHRYVEANGTLASLLTPVQIPPLTLQQAMMVLEEESPQIEAKHKVLLTYPALEAAAQLAEQHITDVPLPSSAIALLDQAAAQVAGRKERWVRKDSIEKALENRTGIPIGPATEQQASQLLGLEDSLHRRIVGQDAAITALAQAIRRVRSGLHEGKRPLSFLFVGPTGVGKTETAKALAEVYFGQASPTIRLDMSEYQDDQATSRLIGQAASGSDSYTEGGLLTQPLRDHPYSLVLLDEFEKASRQVLNLFLQVLDDGRITESTGKVVAVNQAIIIATSNAGSSEIVQLLQQGVKEADLDKQVTSLLLKYFAPELLNRFDAIVPFHPLQPTQLEEVTRHLLQAVVDKARTQGIELTFTPDAVQKIAKLGYDPVFGARPLRRVIQGTVEDTLARLILEQRLQSGGTLQITAEMIQ